MKRRGGLDSVIYTRETLNTNIDVRKPAGKRPIGRAKRRWVQAYNV
jgi:hypothetical protein